MNPNRIPQSKICKICNKKFFKKSNVSKKNWTTRTVFCSLKCANIAKVGKPSWNSGIKIDRSKYPNLGHFSPHSPETLIKITEANRQNAKRHPKSFFVENQKLAIMSGCLRGSYKRPRPWRSGEKNPTWLGDKATYNSKHRWIQKNWIKTGICQKCGVKTTPFGKRRSGTEWHNLDGAYNRNVINTWIEVCSKCHKKFTIWTQAENTTLRK